MSAEFTIDVDPERDLVRVRLAGFFTQEDVMRFLVARNEAHQQLRCPKNQHLTLTDVRDIQIQPQDVVAAFSGLLADPNAQSRRLAFLVPASLARKQLERATQGRPAKFFQDPDVAMEWLLDPAEI